MAAPAQQIVRRKITASEFVVVGLGKIAVPGGGASNPDPARGRFRLEHFDCPALHRRSDEARFLQLRLAIVTDPAALRRAIKGMDRLTKTLAKLSRDFERERGARRDAK